MFREREWERWIVWVCVWIRVRVRVRDREPMRGPKNYMPRIMHAYIIIILAQIYLHFFPFIFHHHGRIYRIPCESGRARAFSFSQSHSTLSIYPRCKLLAFIFLLSTTLFRFFSAILVTGSRKCFMRKMFGVYENEKTLCFYWLRVLCVLWSIAKLISYVTWHRNKEDEREREWGEKKTSK